MMRLVWLTFAAVFLLATGAQAQTLERVRETGTFKIGYREDAAPFSFRDTLGEPAGYSVQLCRLIAAQVKQALGLDKISIEYVPVGTEDRFQAVQDGHIDILCSADTVTLSRRELVDFSLFETGPMFTFAMLAGAAMGMRLSEARELQRPFVTAALAVGVLTWLGAALGVAAPVVIAEHEARQGDDALRAGSPPAAVDHFRRAFSTTWFGNGDFALHVDGFKRKTDDLRVPTYTPVDAEGNVLDRTDRVRNSASDADGGAIGASYTFRSGYIGFSADTSLRRAQ